MIRSILRTSKAGGELRDIGQYPDDARIRSQRGLLAEKQDPECPLKVSVWPLPSRFTGGFHRATGIERGGTSTA